MRFFAITAAAAALAGYAHAAAVGNGTSSGPTVNLFIDDDTNGKGKYAASVVRACNQQTVYALECTGGAVECTAGGPTVTLTEASNVYIASYATVTTIMGYQAGVTVGESCSLTASTEANCAVSYDISVDGTRTSSTATVHMTDIHRYQVAITAGAEKTAAATGACAPNAGVATSPNALRAVGAALAMGLFGVLAL